MSEPTPNFEDLQNGQKTLSENFIIGALTNTLEAAPGERSLMLKGYLDNVPADASDEAFVSNERAVLGFRSDLADFIGSNLKVVISGMLPSDIRDTLKTAKGAYLQKLQADKQPVADWIRGWRSGGRPRMPESAVGFYGFNVNVAGKNLDLTEAADTYSNLRSNITVQRQLSGNFVQWTSTSYLYARAEGQQVPLQSRIYLNPSAETSVDIFQQVVSAAEQKGLKIKGKIYDRSTEAMKGVQRNEAGHMRSMRGDGIVLYAPAGDADELLSIVEEIYTTNYSSAFQGRTTSRIPLKIGEGVAVGSQIGGEEQSLTGHRADVIEDAIRQTRDVVSVSSGEHLTGARRQLVIDTFKHSWAQVAQAAGIDPGNIAFNKRR